MTAVRLEAAARAVQADVARGPRRAPAVKPTACQNAIRYHQMVLDKVGRSVGKSIELFMVPGMYHCQGGRGTDDAANFSCVSESAAGATK